MAAVTLVHGRSAAVERSFAWAQAQSSTAAQTLLRCFEAVKSLHDLVGVRQSLLRLDDAAGVPAIEALLAATAREGRFEVVQVAIIGPDGIQRWGSVPGAAGTNLADRDHFRVHAARGERGLAVSRPLIGRTTGRWSVQVTRPLEVEVAASPASPWSRSTRSHCRMGCSRNSTAPGGWWWSAACRTAPSSPAGRTPKVRSATTQVPTMPSSRRPGPHPSAG